MLVACLRGKAEPIWKDPCGKVYTPDEIATEIEQETEIGRSFVAVGGFILKALNPETP